MHHHSEETLLRIAGFFQKSRGIPWAVGGVADVHMSKIACAIYINHKDDDHLSKKSVGRLIGKTHPETVKTFLLKAVRDNLIEPHPDSLVGAPVGPPQFLIPTDFFIKKIEGYLMKGYEDISLCFEYVKAIQARQIDAVSPRQVRKSFQPYI